MPVSEIQGTRISRATDKSYQNRIRTSQIFIWFVVLGMQEIFRLVDQENTSFRRFTHLEINAEENIFENAGKDE